jgi:hypothetical protein
MDSLHTWGEKYFGYRDGNNLWTHNGKHVGRFDNEEIYDKNGHYLGELKNGRLITNRQKKSKHGNSFSPYGNRVGVVPSVGYIGSVMYVGFEEFPSPDEF